MPRGRPAKKRRLTPPTHDHEASETIPAGKLFDRAVDWDLEQDYEQRIRKKKTKESTKLPIKNAEGKIENVQEVPAEDDVDSFLGSGTEDENRSETPPTEDLEMSPQIPLHQQILQAKEEIARLAALISEDPEEHAGSFKKLAQLANSDSHPSIQKVAMAAQVAIYKDVIPGYRIRAYTDEDMSSKVSKDVRKTRQYEQALITGYQSFVKSLVKICKESRSNTSKSDLKLVALSCVCTLLLSVPHFNFRTDLLNVLVRQLSSRNPGDMFNKSVRTLEEFFEGDEDGAPSLEAVTLLSKMLKAQDYHIREEVLNTFFHLRLLSELSAKSSMTRTDKPEDVSRYHGRKVKKDKWEHRSKKERKLAKERKAVEKDMQEADAAVDYEAREKMQSETLKMVFIIYFRILKARTPELMGAVLEGLARCAHLINQDFFGDILEALKDIVNQASSADDLSPEEEDEEHPRNWTRESLLSTQTAFTLLSQQDASKAASALHLDLSFFTSNVYRSLPALALDADIELGPKSLHLPDPHTSPSTKMDNKINISTPTLLLTRALTAILLTPSQPPSTQVVAAFYKRMLSTSVQLPEKSVLAILDLMERVIDKHGRKAEALWYSEERKGDGVFRGDATSIEATNVFASGTGVWEAELLKHHYCPQVREKMKGIDGMVNAMAK